MVGLPKSYVKKYGISKRAWQEYRKACGGKRRLPRKRTTRRKRVSRKRSIVRRVKRRVRRRAKPKTKSRSRGFLNAGTLLSLATKGALVAPAVHALVDAPTPKSKLNRFIRYYTGYNLTSNKFDGTDLAKGWLPYITTKLMTAGVQKISGMLRKF